ncbi:MAG: hypothetical protein WBI07_19880 [Mobilitalea sp.]
MVNKAFVYHAKYGKGILVDKLECSYCINFDGEVKNFVNNLWGTKLFLCQADVEAYKTYNQSAILECASQYEVLNAQDMFESELRNKKKRDKEIADTTERINMEFILIYNNDDIIGIDVYSKELVVVAPYSIRIEEVFNCKNYIHQIKEIPLLTRCLAEVAVIEQIDELSGDIVILSDIQQIEKISVKYLRACDKNFNEILIYKNAPVLPFDEILNKSKNLSNRQYYIAKFTGTKILSQENKKGKLKYQIKMDRVYVNITDKYWGLSTKENLYYCGLVLIQAIPIPDGFTGYNAVHLYENKFLSETQNAENKLRHKKYEQARVEKYLYEKDSVFAGFEVHEQLSLLNNFKEKIIEENNQDESFIAQLDSDIACVEYVVRLFLSKADNALERYNSLLASSERYPFIQPSENCDEWNHEECMEFDDSDYDLDVHEEYNDQDFDSDEEECDDAYFSNWQEEYGEYEGSKSGTKFEGEILEEGGFRKM